MKLEQMTKWNQYQILLIKFKNSKLIKDFPWRVK